MLNQALQQVHEQNMPVLASAHGPDLLHGDHGSSHEPPLSMYLHRPHGMAVHDCCWCRSSAALRTAMLSMSMGKWIHARTPRRSTLSWHWLTSRRLRSG